MGVFLKCSQTHSQKQLMIDNPRSLNESEFETEQSLTETRITQFIDREGQSTARKSSNADQ